MLTSFSSTGISIHVGQLILVLLLRVFLYILSSMMGIDGYFFSIKIFPQIFCFPNIYLKNSALILLH